MNLRVRYDYHSCFTDETTEAKDEITYHMEAWSLTQESTLSATTISSLTKCPLECPTFTNMKRETSCLGFAATMLEYLKNTILLHKNRSSLLNVLYSEKKVNEDFLPNPLNN